MKQTIVEVIAEREQAKCELELLRADYENLRRVNLSLGKVINEKSERITYLEKSLRTGRATEVPTSNTQDHVIVETLLNHTRNLGVGQSLSIDRDGNVFKVFDAAKSTNKRYIGRLWKTTSGGVLAVNNSSELFRSRSFANTISVSDDEYDSWKKRKALRRALKSGMKHKRSKSKTAVSDGIVDALNWLVEVFSA